MTEKIAIVKPINETKYDFKQSKYDYVPQVPFRALITGPSGSGKSLMLVSMILDIYKNVFSRVYIFSPSIEVDSIWLPVKKYIREELGVDTEKEKCWFDEFKPQDLEKIIETQHKITEWSKKTV